MGCGASSLKGEEVHDLTDMPRSTPHANPNPPSYADSAPPIRVTNSSGSTGEPSNPDGSRNPSRASRFQSAVSAGSFSFSSPAPRKKKKQLTDEELLKHTGMTAEQLKQWGDGMVYRREYVGGGTGAMGVGMTAFGGVGA